MIEQFNTVCGHSLLERGKIICIECDGNKIDNIISSNCNTYIAKIIKHRYPFIKHFRTYSLKEYCQQKLNVRNQFTGGDIRRCLLSQYYYKINRRTSDKDAFVEKWRKEHSQNYLFICSKETFVKNHWLKEHFCYVFGNPLGIIEVLKSDTKFQGINSLNAIIDDMDYIVFL